MPSETCQQQYLARERELDLISQLAYVRNMLRRNADLDPAFVQAVRLEMAEQMRLNGAEAMPTHKALNDGGRPVSAGGQNWGGC